MPPITLATSVALMIVAGIPEAWLIAEAVVGIVFTGAMVMAALRRKQSPLSPGHCQLTIDLPITGAPTPSGVDVTVSGTASPISDPANFTCDRVNVTISCGTHSASGLSPCVYDSVRQAYTWLVTLPTECKCGEAVTIFVECTNHQCSASASGNIVCPDCCPTIATAVTIGNCAADGTRPVTFNITVTTNPNCPQSTLILVLGNGNSATSQGFPPNGTWTLTYNYAPGTYVATITPQLSGNYCPVVSTSISLNVPPCQLTNQDDCEPKDLEDWTKKYLGVKLKCRLLFHVMSVSAAHGLFMFLFGVCKPNAWLWGLSIPILVIAGLTFWLYTKFCKKCICGWPWLFQWRVLCSSGFLLTALSKCCLPYLWVGTGMIVLGLVALIVFWTACKVDPCNIEWEVRWWWFLPTGWGWLWIFWFPVFFNCVVNNGTATLGALIAIAFVVTLFLFVVFMGSKCSGKPKPDWWKL